VFGLNTTGTSAMVLAQPTNALVEKKSIEAMRSCPVCAIGVAEA
jgi:ferredoxin